MKSLESDRLGLSISAGQAWVLTAVVALVVLVGGVLAVPRLVYDRFIWQYFWGPIYADAHTAACAVREGGTVRLLGAEGCAQAVTTGKIVAEPGYTLVSEAGYAVILIFMLAGVLFLLRQLDVGHDRRLFFALVPFMVFGGALRVVEDATDAAVTAGIGYPFNTLIISPIIYVVVFLITLAALLVTITLSRREILDQYTPPLAGIGTAAFLLSVGYIGALVLGSTNTKGEFYPQFTGVVVMLSILIAGGVYLAVDRHAPWVNAGTERMGLVVFFGQILDGVANVIAADWATSLGLPGNYDPKHPINQLIIDSTKSVLPASATEIIGSAWPFLLVKVIAAVAVVSLFDERIFEENPRYALLLLVAIVAVGLGPGTRDMLRATFGI